MDNIGDNAEEVRMLRAIRVIESVSDSSLPVSIAQLVSRTGIPKATLARLISGLASTGYLSFVPGRRELVPGPRAAKLGLRVLGNGHFRRECRAILRELVSRLGETCNLTVRDGDSVMYIERVETDAPLRMHLEPGTRAPYHCTAGGKLFLSDMTPSERDRFLAHSALEKRTPGTITNLSDLGREIDRIHRLGYGVDNEEFVAGMVGIAVPVRSTLSGALTAALVCHAATARATLGELERKISILKVAAGKVEILCGG